MHPLLLLKAIGFFLLVVIGIPGNMFILIQFTFIKIIEKKLLPTNTILTVLATANLLVIFSRIIPQSLYAIGIEDLLDNTECKLVIYTYRVSRAMSICTTSLLSCHQCILIAPSTKVWTYLKQKVSQNVMTIIIILCFINLSMYPYSFLALARKKYHNVPIRSTLDFIFVGLMALASIYIVFTLLRHEKTVKGIRSSNRGQKRSTEYKASRVVILLVALYVVLFGLDNSMWIYTLTLSNASSDMNDIRIFLASSYATLSPIVIIITNPKLKHSWKNSFRKQSFHGDAGLVFSISK
ncbi:hypothetical protein GDO81_006352 [Engystomops pustulosus]|uniref:Vomeronasal type-1 receptor n=1 Tax=Engystomops pustulosus TaxID=76066 RepID=A0AAV7CZ91_ENGPU|nr:hypothetical protein GDO81_006352 [Engystomops pustulosus]